MYLLRSILCHNQHKQTCSQSWSSWSNKESLWSSWLQFQSFDRWVLAADRGVHSADRWVHSADRWIHSADRGVHSADRWVHAADKGCRYVRPFQCFSLVMRIKYLACSEPLGFIFQCFVSCCINTSVVLMSSIYKLIFCSRL